MLDTFFEDARTKLVGPRPDYEAKASAATDDAQAQAPSTSPTVFAWSRLITADTLETEVKRMSQSTTAPVKNAGQFNSGGYKSVRRDFGELAVLFAVAAQYDGEVRWKDVAAGLRDELSHAAAQIKTGGDPAYRAAAALVSKLGDLVRGDRPHVGKADAAVADWSQVAARPLLMQRLNIAHQERLTKWLADKDTFQRNQNDVAHEAQILAIIAEVIHRPQFEFTDDDTYIDYARELEQAGNDMHAAAESGNFQQAREAVGRATKACAKCHEGYRG